MSFLSGLRRAILGPPPKRRKAQKRRNPSAAVESQIFHGESGEVRNLSPGERAPLPKSVMVLGEIESITYKPPGRSQRGRWSWSHQSGDCGGSRKAAGKPLLVANPRTDRPAIVMGKSKMKVDPRRGLVC